MRLNASALGVVVAALPAGVLSELVTKYAYPSTCKAIYTTVDAAATNIFTNGTAIFTSGSSTVTIAQPGSSSTALSDEALNSGAVPFTLQVQPGAASRKRQAAPYINAGGYTTSDASQVAQYVIHNGTLGGTSGGWVSANAGVENMPFAISQTQYPISTRFFFKDLQLHWNNTAFENGIAGFFSVSAGNGSIHIIVRLGGVIDSRWTPIKLVAVAASGLTIQSSAVTVGTTTASSTLSMGSMQAPSYAGGATTTQSRPTSGALSSYGATPSSSGVSTVLITPIPATSSSSSASSSSPLSSSASTAPGYSSVLSSSSSTTSSSSTNGLSSSTTSSSSSSSSSTALTSAAVPVAPSSVQSVSPYISSTSTSTTSSSAVATGAVCTTIDGSTGITSDGTGQCYQYYCGGIGEFGPDIAGTTQSKSTFAQCMQYCDTVNGCLAVTFVSGTCYPKSGDTVNSGNAGVAMARKASCPGATSSSTSTAASAPAYSSPGASSAARYLILPSPTACNFGDPPSWNEDDTYERIDLPQAMTIGSTSATDTYASTNGFVSISAGSAQYQYEQLPTIHLPARTIAPYWADLYVYRRGATGNPQGLFYQLNSTGISYEWYLSRAGEPDSIYHFMVDYYYNTPGVFTYTYYQIGNGENGQFATVGMQSSDTTGYNVGFNVTGSVTPGTVVKCDTTAGTCLKSY